MDIDKLIRCPQSGARWSSFSSLMDIDKLIHTTLGLTELLVLVLGWILINLYLGEYPAVGLSVLVLGWILINLYQAPSVESVE